MLNNPFAKVFRQAFSDDVLKGAVYTPVHEPVYADRVHCFVNSLNHFLQTSGQPPVDYQNYLFDEHKLFEYALFLRGYMRDAQVVLAHLEQKYAADAQLINLFQASSEYVVACNHQLNDRRIFDNNVDYHTWKINLASGLQKAHYEKTQPLQTRHNLFLFMPFRIKNDQETIAKWTYTNMRKTLDNQHIFGRNADVYLTYYPIQKSRASNITSLLKTLHDSKTYYEKQDMEFVKRNWLPFVAQDIEISADNKIVSAQPYTAEELHQNFRNITIFSYCAGTANAHRCLNALYHISSQIYGEEVAKSAMQNVFITSYGYLPIQKHSLYSGAHFYSNAIDDDMQREPFVNLNNHQLYEQTKCKNSSAPARFSVMPDGRNYIIALKLAQPLTIIEDGKITNISDGEFGHNMANINTPNPNNTFPHALFKAVIENSTMGKRGQHVFNIDQMQNQTVNIALQSNMEKIR